MTYPLPCPECGRPGTDVRIFTDFRTAYVAVHCKGCGFVAKSKGMDGPIGSPIGIWNACVTARMEKKTRDGKEAGQ